MHLPRRLFGALNSSLAAVSILTVLAAPGSIKTGLAQGQLPPLTVEAPRKAPAKKAAAKKAQPTEAQPPTPAATPPATAPVAAAAKLDAPNAVGSQLGLTPSETPATINIVTQKDMEEKGARSLVEAYRTVPGVVAGNLPGEPGVTSMRGFSRAATGYAIDGFRAVDPLLISRDYDTFNFERIEVLKGPASVVYGTDALAGSINIVTKQAILGKTETEAMTSFGSFGTLRTGAGVNAPIGPGAAIRSTISASRSDGYVDDTDSEKLAFTNNVLLKPTDRLSVSISADYFHDDFSTAYQGIPLIPASIARDPTNLVSAPGGLVVDKSLRAKNYNVEDGRMAADTFWLRSRAEYKLTSDWTFRNELGFYTADRSWVGSEDFTYDDKTGRLDRSTTKILHDHQFWSERASLAYDGLVLGTRNRFVAGLEYIDTAFASVRRFGTCSTPTDSNPKSCQSVDPFNPDRGTFPADTNGNFTTRQDFDSAVQTSAAFMENAINLTPAWILVGGIRYERTALDRQIDNLNGGTTPPFDKTFQSATWRVGSVYEIAKGTSLFAQYTEAVVPVTTLLLSNLANSKFDLSTGESIEAGIRSGLLGGRLLATASVYQIDQDNILTNVSSQVTVQGGSQRSRGVEVETSLALTERWSITASGTLIDAKFTALENAAGDDLTGNRPVNVPDYMWYLASSYRLETLPITLGASLYGVGSFYTDRENTIEVRERALLDAWVAYDIGGGTLRLRGRNLTDEFYADWSGYSSKQVYLGAPRSFDISYAIKW
jgi:iron complex outermembrane receptor protein